MPLTVLVWFLRTQVKYFVKIFYLFTFLTRFSHFFSNRKGCWFISFFLVDFYQRILLRWMINIKELLIFLTCSLKDRILLWFRFWIKLIFYKVEIFIFCQFFFVAIIGYGPLLSSSYNDRNFIQTEFFEYSEICSNRSNLCLLLLSKRIVDLVNLFFCEFQSALRLNFFFNPLGQFLFSCLIFAWPPFLSFFIWIWILNEFMFLLDSI